MTKYVYGLLLLIGMGMFYPIMGSADDFTETSFAPAFNTTADPLTYYWATQKTVILERQVIGTVYGLCIGANQPTSERQWINYTATQSIAHITFRHTTAPYSLTDERLVYLLLTLYTIAGGDTPITNLTLTIIYPTDQYQPADIMYSLALMGTVVVVGIIVIILIKRR